MSTTPPFPEAELLAYRRLNGPTVVTEAHPYFNYYTAKWIGDMPSFVEVGLTRKQAIARLHIITNLLTSTHHVSVSTSNHISL